MVSGSIYGKMKTNSKVRSLTRSLMRLFVTKKRNVTRLNRKDDYYRDYYFKKKLSDGIELVAAIERTSKKRAAEMIMSAGFSSYMGEKITEHIRAEQAARARNERVQRNRFAQQMIRFARERGMDLKQFFK
jgi:transposase